MTYSQLATSQNNILSLSGDEFNHIVDERKVDAICLGVSTRSGLLLSRLSCSKSRVYVETLGAEFVQRWKREAGVSSMEQPKRSEYDEMCAQVKERLDTIPVYAAQEFLTKFPRVYAPGGHGQTNGFPSTCTVSGYLLSIADSAIPFEYRSYLSEEKLDSGVFPTKLPSDFTNYLCGDRVSRNTFS